MMKKAVVWILCLLLFVFCLTFSRAAPLPDLAIKSFDRLMRWERAREVFDLDEEEAVAVFGDGSEDVLL